MAYGTSTLVNLSRRGPSSRIHALVTAPVWVDAILTDDTVGHCEINEMATVKRRQFRASVLPTAPREVAAGSVQIHDCLNSKNVFPTTSSKNVQVNGQQAPPQPGSDPPALWWDSSFESLEEIDSKKASCSSPSVLNSSVYLSLEGEVEDAEGDDELEAFMKEVSAQNLASEGKPKSGYEMAFERLSIKRKKEQSERQNTNLRNEANDKKHPVLEQKDSGHSDNSVSQKEEVSEDISQVKSHSYTGGPRDQSDLPATRVRATTLRRKLELELKIKEGAEKLIKAYERMENNSPRTGHESSGERRDAGSREERGREEERKTEAAKAHEETDEVFGVEPVVGRGSILREATVMLRDSTARVEMLRQRLESQRSSRSSFIDAGSMEKKKILSTRSHPSLKTNEKLKMQGENVIDDDEDDEFMTYNELHRRRSSALSPLTIRILKIQRRLQEEATIAREARQALGLATVKAVVAGTEGTTGPEEADKDATLTEDRSTGEARGAMLNHGINPFNEKSLARRLKEAEERLDLLKLALSKRTREKVMKGKEEEEEEERRRRGISSTDEEEDCLQMDEVDLDKKVVEEFKEITPKQKKKFET